MFVEIEEGMLLEDTIDNEHYRVVSLVKSSAWLCNAESTSLLFKKESLKELRNKFKSGQYRKINENFLVVDRSALNDRQLEKLNTSSKFCREVLALVHNDPSYLCPHGPKPLLKNIRDKYGLSRKEQNRLLLTYFQSGFQDSAFLDKRSSNSGNRTDSRYNAGSRKQKESTTHFLNESDLKSMDKYMRQYLRNEIKSISQAYADMIENDYMEIVTVESPSGSPKQKQKLVSPEKRPTERQFRRYILGNTTKEQRQAAKNTAMNVRNNERVFRGTVVENVLGPGHVVECDAQEMDIALISSDYPDQAVGRPILYAMIDVQTQMILSVSLAMDNNSVVGLTNLFANLIIDHKSLLDQYGVTLSDSLAENYTLEELWPSDILPRTMKYDNGSDFISKPIGRILNDLNIDVEYVSPGTGSLKPLVEHLFGTIKRNLDDLLYKNGLIDSKHNSKHHKQSVLTFDEAYAIVLNCVLRHNGHVLANYVTSAEMQQQGILPSPANLWKFQSENLMRPKKVRNRDEFLYNILLPAKASASRKGIKFKGMHYFARNDTDLSISLFNTGNKSYKFECRYDPRDMGHLYYIQNGVLKTLSLPENDLRYSSYFGMSEKQFDYLKGLEKANKQTTNDLNLQLRIEERQKNRAIIQNAKKSSTKNSSTKDIQQARKMEKEKISSENAFYKKFDVEEYSEKNESDHASKKGIAKKQDLSAERISESESVPFAPDAGDNNLTAEERNQKAFEEQWAALEKYF